MVSCIKKLAPLAVLALITACNSKGNAPGLFTVKNLRMFQTAQVAPTFGGAVGADAICASEATSKSLTGKFKAVIVSGARRACTTANCSGGTSENLAWVLKANTTYYRLDGTTIIGTTNAGGVFEAALDNPVEDTNQDTIWTGLRSDWTNQASENCDNWYNVNGAGGATTGDTSSTDNWAFGTNGSTYSCSNTLRLVCAEQAGSGPTTASDTPPTPPCTTCRIFVTSSTYNGNFGGISGADDICNNDGQSGSDPYKALLGGRNPLYANTAYIRPDGTPIGTTNGSKQFSFPLTNAVTAASQTVWTGIAANWANFNTCLSWTNGTGSQNSNLGNASQTGTGMLNTSIQTCDNQHRIYCVQQF